MLKNNLNAELILTNKRIATIQPKYYLPYGGFAEATATRDQYIKQKMIQHTPKSYEDICNKNGISCLEIEKNLLLSEFEYGLPIQL